MFRISSLIGRPICIKSFFLKISSKRELKKFYKDVSIVRSNCTIDKITEPQYAVILDQRKLRTPAGNAFMIPHEGLALAVAHEWNVQKDIIEQFSMPLTTMCNTVLDNPTELSKEKIVAGILEYADTDTISYRVDSPDDLVAEQEEKWGEILTFIERQYHFRPPVTTGFSLLKLPEDFRQFIFRHFLSYNRWGLVGFQTCVETLKSVWLTLAMVDGCISSERAVELSRMEQAFQENRWGSVPWFHEIDKVEMNTRVASGLLIILTSHARQSVKTRVDHHKLVAS